MPKEPAEGKKQGPAPKEKLEPMVVVKAVAAVVLGWVLPGAGHMFLRKAGRGLVFLLIIFFMLGFGLYLGGKTYPRSVSESERITETTEGVDFLSYFATFACLGSGPVYFIIRSSPKVYYGQGRVESSSHEYGTTFILVAGLLNMLLLLDAFDISIGRKN
jgi:hypothetical protein